MFMLQNIPIIVIFQKMIQIILVNKNAPNDTSELKKTKSEKMTRIWKKDLKLKKRFESEKVKP